MKVSEMKIGHVYVGSWDRDSKRIIFIWMGGFDKDTSCINSDGEYVYKNCGADDLNFREANEDEIALLNKEIFHHNNVHYPLPIGTKVILVQTGEVTEVESIRKDRYPMKLKGKDGWWSFAPLYLYKDTDVNKNKEFKVGDKFIGFSFKSEKYKFLDREAKLTYNKFMDEHIGKVGIIIRVHKHSVSVKFDSSVREWSYPINQNVTEDIYNYKSNINLKSSKHEVQSEITTIRESSREEAIRLRRSTSKTTSGERFVGNEIKIVTRRGKIGEAKIQPTSISTSNH